MKKENIKLTPGSASEWYDLGVSLMRQSRFGDAINAFNRAAELASAELASSAELAAAELVSSAELVDLSPKDTSAPSPVQNPESYARAAFLNDIIRKSLASIEIIREIIGFVNKDLMNP